MKYLVDHEVLIAVVDGNRLVIQMLEWHRRAHVRVPEPVLEAVARHAQTAATAAGRERWQLLAPEVPRMSWTKEVTDVLLAIRAPESVSRLDLLVVAHAIAAKLEIVTRDVDRFVWIPEVRVSAIGA